VSELNYNASGCVPNWFDRLFFVFVIIFSGGALAFVRSQGAMILLGTGAALSLVLHGMFPRRSFFTALLVWMGYFVLSTLSIGSFHPYFMLEIPILMLAGYALINVWGNKIFEHYSRCIYILSAISLVFYAWHLVLPGTLRNFVDAFDCQGDLFPQAWRNCGSVIIYSINETVGTGGIPRNCGFCWEPGPFSCFIVLALFFNYCLNTPEKRSRKINLILIAALLTTFSTTGYMMFGCLAIYYIWQHQNNLVRIGSIFAVLVAVVLFFQLDFLGQKVQDQLEMTNDWSILVENSRLYGKHYTPGRFISLKLAWMNFEERPIFGYAGNTLLEYSYLQGASVAVISGIGLIMARYGACGLLMFSVILLTSGRRMQQDSRQKSCFIFILWLVFNVMIGISFKLMFTPIFFGFFFCGLFQQQKNAADDEPAPQLPPAAGSDPGLPEKLPEATALVSIQRGAETI